MSAHMQRFWTTLVRQILEFSITADHLHSEIMLYNLWGPWSPAVGPNAPLRDSCTVHKHGSVEDSLAIWTAAGFPANQLVLAVASYGYSYYVTNSNAIKDGTIAYYPPFDAAKQPHGDVWDTSDEGIFDFWGLIEGGFLTKEGTVAKGNYYRLDACTEVVRNVQMPHLLLLIISVHLALRVQPRDRCYGVLRRCDILWSVHVPGSPVSLD
jgi:hypothetical protein